jgi:hypothetical protein
MNSGFTPLRTANSTVLFLASEKLQKVRTDLSVISDWRANFAPFRFYVRFFQWQSCRAA